MSIASAGLRDGTEFEQFVMRMRRTAAVAVVNDLGQVLLRWRHRFITGRCGWEMPGIHVPAHDRKCRLTPGSLCCTPDKRRGL